MVCVFVRFELVFCCSGWILLILVFSAFDFWDLVICGLGGL